MQIKVALIFGLVIIFVATQTKMLYTFNIIRNGASYPKNDLYDGNSTKQFRGMLTGVGLRQQYNLGTYLKQNYIVQQQLTTQKFNPNHVEFFSHSYDRCGKSILALAYGLYPLGVGWKIPEEVPQDKLNPPYVPLQASHLKQQVDLPFALDQGFQVVPVRTLDEILDNCPNYGILISDRLRQISKQLSSFQTQQSLFIAKMKVVFNLTALQSNLATMSDLYQTLYSDQYLGRSLPKDYSDIDAKNLKYIYEQYNTLVFNGHFGSLLSTPLIKFLKMKLAGQTKQTINKKLTFISAPSTNIIPLLNILNLTSAQCITQKWKGQPITSINCVDPPAFSANLIFEILVDDSFQYTVRVKYNGFYAFLCQKKSTSCRYQQFVERLSVYQVNSYEAQCKVKAESHQENIVEM